jgi:DNA repair exonuclease SbcCD ATPase subunit
MKAVRDRVASIDRDQTEKDVQRLRFLETDVAAAEQLSRQNQDLIGKVADAENELKTARVGVERLIEKTEDQIERAEKAAKLIDAVPCQDFKRDDPDEQHVAEVFAAGAKNCRFLKDAIAARGQIPELKKGLDVSKKNRKAMDTGGLANKVRDLRREHLALGYDRKSHDEKAKERDRLSGLGLDKRLRDLDGASAQLNGLKAQITQTDQTIQKLLDNGGSWTDEKKTCLDDSYTRLSVLQADKNAADTEKELAAANLATARETYAKREGLLEKLYADRDDHEKTQALANVETKRLRTVQAYRSAVSRSGIPYYLLEQSLPRIQGYINDLLKGSSLSVRIDAVRDRATTVSEEVGITFQDGNGSHPLGAASGGQANLLAVPYRVALALIESEARGAVPENFWIDEGFGAYDSENLSVARDMLKNIAASFRRVVFITHVGEMQKIADTNLVVESSPFGGSSTLRKAD